MTQKKKLHVSLDRTVVTVVVVFLLEKSKAVLFNMFVEQIQL
jgi:hypothetical protein